jgi:hypothetical protein
MTISGKELRALLQKSGNRCAFPGCPELLSQLPIDENDKITNLSNIAHIVAQSDKGPRGQYPLPIDQRDQESNLLLLCSRHHTVIDNEPQRYTVERLRQFKEDHEKMIEKATGNAIAGQPEPKHVVKEILFSTLFLIDEMPLYIYSAPLLSPHSTINEIRVKIITPKDKTEIYPFIIRENKLYAFQNLRYFQGPFKNVIDRTSLSQIRAYEFWNDEITHLWFIDLLNKSLNKLTGRKGLSWDREHKRYYFSPDNPGEVKEIEYRPLNKSKSKKQVVWQPISRKTDEPYPYWLHRAVNLKFHQINHAQWCLSIRPEFRVTKDGFELLESERIGAKVTRKKSKMFNYDLLGEVNFWRDFLCESEPRIILNFGKDQHIIISSNMLQTEIEWPGIPEKYAKPFKNIDYQDDLFSWAKLANLNVDYDDEVEEDFWEEENDD